MKIIKLMLFICLSKLTFGQTPSENTYITWEDFAKEYNTEIKSALDVYALMTKNGLQEHALSIFDFYFVSDKKENLDNLSQFIRSHYPYKINTIKETANNLWELHGTTNELSVTEDNLVFWGLDMYKRGYEFDCTLEEYGSPIDSKNPKMPDFDKSMESTYFDKAMTCYNSGNLSGAIINFTNVINVNPTEEISYYSRAIIKSELYARNAALEDYNKALEIDPTYTAALTNRGSLKDEMGDHKGAIEDYNTVLNMDDLSVDDKQITFYNRGNAYYNLEKTKKACKDWEASYNSGAEYALERMNKFCK